MESPLIASAWLKPDYRASLEQAGARIRELTPADALAGALAGCRGLMLTGGVDVRPRAYGEEDVHDTVEIDPVRDQFELALAREALARDLPVLAICRGAQVLNTAAGGTLVQDIPSALPESLNHQRLEHTNKDVPVHDVSVVRGTCLWTLLEPRLDAQGSMAVNSRHHQAVKAPGKGFVVSAISPDGIIEAIEKPAAQFCVGVQWHPENFRTGGEFGSLFDGFVAAARRRLSQSEKQQVQHVMSNQIEVEEDFAAMFEASFKAKRFQNGQTIEGTIVAIGNEAAFVNVGGKGEATIELSELRDEDGALEVAVGEKIQATVVSTAGGIKLSRRLQRGAATARQLEDAFRAGLPVEGKVEKAIKGGYEVSIARQRAFCPFSQMDLSRQSDESAHNGRVYTFKIIEYREGGKKFVVSRRALLEEEQKARAVEVRKSIAIGAVITGRVVSVRDFGAFIDLGGGVQGLLHVSEMGWSRVSDTTQFATPGQEITVQVLRMDDKTQQIALGLKQLTADPWTTAQSAYAVGQVVQGRVTRVAEFGAFVELAPGIEALAHVSTFAPAGRSGGWARTVPPGTTVAFEIVSIDPAKKRIGVSLVDGRPSKTAAAAEEAADLREYAERQDAAKDAAKGAADTTSFGSLADKLRGALTRRDK